MQKVLFWRQMIKPQKVQKKKTRRAPIESESGCKKK